jgi:FtsZ-interacting cell division protein ZipA
MIKKTWKIIAGIVAGIFGLIFIFGKKSNNKKAEQAKKEIDDNNVNINKLDGKIEEVKKQKTVAKKKVTTTKKQIASTKAKKAAPKKATPKKSVKSAKANIKKKIRK